MKLEETEKYKATICKQHPNYYFTDKQYQRL